MKNALRLCALTILMIAVALLTNPAAQAADARGKLLKRADSEIHKGEFEKADATYQELLALDAQDKEARLGLSFVKLKQLKLQESFDLATETLKAYPLSARAHSLVGTALLRSGEFRTSQEALYTAVKLADRQALAYAGLSEIE